jgi:hypothetical protein
MSKEHAFYFVNHTRKEFIYFPKNLPISEALQDVLDNYVGWTSKDNIRIDSEAYDNTDCLERMDAMRYTMAKPMTEEKEKIVRTILDNLDAKLAAYKSN